MVQITYHSNTEPIAECVPFVKMSNTFNKSADDLQKTGHKTGKKENQNQSINHTRGMMNPRMLRQINRKGHRHSNN